MRKKRQKEMEWTVEDKQKDRREEKGQKDRRMERSEEEVKGQRHGGGKEVAEQMREKEMRKERKGPVEKTVKM